ncbi:MAG TPA: hypothetical protein VM165_18165, partial [Planctomycetaceae bacterium]|nr:hypothetical protein [Planctomycetaceae bacterium]
MMDSEPRANPDDAKKPAPPRKPERGVNNSLFWYLLVGIFLAALVFSFGSRATRGESLDVSEFKARLVAGTLNAANVHKLVIGISRITFQDAPELKSTTGSKHTPKQFTVAIRAISPDGRHEIEQALGAAGIKYQSEDETTDWLPLIYTLVMVSLFLGFMIFLFRRIGGPGAAMSF